MKFILLVLALSPTWGFGSGLNSETKFIAERHISELYQLSIKENKEKYSSYSTLSPNLTKKWNQVIDDFFTENKTRMPNSSEDSKLSRKLISFIDNKYVKIRKVNNKYSVMDSSKSISLSDINSFNMLLSNGLGGMYSSGAITFSASENSMDFLKKSIIEYQKRKKKAYLVNGKKKSPFTDSFGNLYMHKNDYHAFIVNKIINPVLYHEVLHLPDKIFNSGKSFGKKSFENLFTVMSNQALDDAKETMYKYMSKEEKVELEKELGNIRKKSIIMASEPINIYYDSMQEIHIDEIAFRYVTNEEVKKFLNYMKNSSFNNRYNTPNDRVLSTMKDPYSYMIKYYTSDKVFSTTKDILSFISEKYNGY